MDRIHIGDKDKAKFLCNLNHISPTWYLRVLSAAVFPRQYISVSLFVAVGIKVLFLLSKYSERETKLITDALTHMYLASID